MSHLPCNNQSMEHSPDHHPAEFQRRDLNTYRLHLFETIRDQKPVWFRQIPRHGDTLIHTHSLGLFLNKFSNKHKLPPAILQSYLPSQSDTYASFDPFSAAKTLINTLPHEQESAQSVLEYLQRRLAYLFDVPFVWEHTIIPQAIPLDYGPLADYNENATIQQGQNIKEKFGNRPIITIYQSGSSPLKRFSDANSRMFLSSIQQKLPQAAVVLLSDEHTRITQADGFDTVLMRPDVNTVGAYGFASDVIIGTDTFWGWLTSGCQTLRTDSSNTQRIILYTLADSYFWGIPQSIHLRSHAFYNPEIFRYLQHSNLLTNHEYDLLTNMGMLQRTIHPKDITAVSHAIQSIL